jgi:hypothetical protein
MFGAKQKAFRLTYIILITALKHTVNCNNKLDITDLLISGFQACSIGSTLYRFLYVSKFRNIESSRTKVNRSS